MNAVIVCCGYGLIKTPKLNPLAFFANTSDSINLKTQFRICKSVPCKILACEYLTSSAAVQLDYGLVKGDVFSLRDVLR